MEDPQDCMLLLKRWKDGPSPLFFVCSDLLPTMAIQLTGCITRLEPHLSFSTTSGFPIVSAVVPLSDASLSLVPVAAANSELRGTTAEPFEMVVEVKFVEGGRE